MIKLNKKISFVMALLFSISLISALTIYSGESIEVELEKPFAYYSVVGNSTAVDLTITLDGNIATITPNKYSQNDSYELIFFDIDKETITVYSSGGGGSSGGGTRTIYRDRNITSYLDREVKVNVDVPGETIEVEVEVEKIVGKNTLYYGIGIIVLLGIIAYLIFRGKEYTDERRYEQNE